MNTIIFDFDGTIANSLEFTRQLFNKIAPKYNLPIITDADISKIREMSAKEILSMYPLSPWKLLRLTSEIQIKLKKMLPQISPVDGIKELLHDLKQCGMRIGIVTSNSLENVDLFLKSHHIDNVDFVHSEKNLFGKGKVLSHLIRQQKINKQEVFYVGDEVRDIEAARAADIPIISVTWGFNSLKRLEKARPDYLVNKPAEIFNHFLINS